MLSVQSKIFPGQNLDILTSSGSKPEDFSVFQVGTRKFSVFQVGTRTNFQIVPGRNSEFRGPRCFFGVEIFFQEKWNPSIYVIPTMWKL